MTFQAQTAAGQLLISCTGNVANSRPRRPVQLFKIYHTYIRCTHALYGSEPVEKPDIPETINSLGRYGIMQRAI